MNRLHEQPEDDARGLIGGALERVLLVFLLVALRLLLEGIYRWVLAPSYGYLGLVLVDVDPAIHAMSFFVSAAPALWLPRRIDRPSRVISLVVALSVLVPSSFVPLVSGALSGIESLSVAGALAVSHLILTVIPDRLQFDVRVLPSMPSWPWLPAVALAVLMAPLLLALGVPDGVPSLSEVYDVRFSYRAALAGPLGRVVAYALPWCGTALVPLVLVYGLERRRKAYVAAAYLAALYIFASTGLKSLFVAPFLVHTAWALLRSRHWNRSVTMVSLALLCLLGAVAVDSAIGKPFVNGLITRRAVMVPGLLTGYYVRFFSDNRPYLLSTSIASSLQRPAYPATAPFVIGSNFFDDEETSANANFLADGFAQLRWAGFLFVALALGVALAIADLALRDLRPHSASAVVLPLAIALSNSALTTVLFTHGMLLLIIVGATAGLRVNRDAAGGQGQFGLSSTLQ